jgi:hypothetical protein
MTSSLYSPEWVEKLSNKQLEGILMVRSQWGTMAKWDSSAPLIG